MRATAISMAALLSMSSGEATAQKACQPTPILLIAGDNRSTAMSAASLLERRYGDPVIGKRYAAALRSHAENGVYATIRDRQALADRLSEDLQAVHADGHLRFYISRLEAQPLPPPAKPTAGHAGPITAREGEASIAPGIRAIRWAAPGVAYISFEHFDDRPEAIAAVSRFLIDYASAHALIIDSRENHGGAFDMLGLFANALFSEPRLLANMDMAKSVVDEFGAPFPVDGAVLKRVAGPPGLVRFQHWAVPAHAGNWASIPVFYLTSHTTFSAAEHMAMILKSTNRAMLIGETTGGGNHFGGTEPVGSGLELYVPIGRTSDPVTGRDWEQIGIVPNLAVAPSDALGVALAKASSAVAAASPR